jgi:hypothetical protein
MSHSHDKNSPDSAINRLAELLSELTDGEYSPEIVEEIRQLVADDQAALQWYCEWMSVHSQLYLDMAVGEVGAEMPSGPPEPNAPQHASPATIAYATPRRRMWPLAMLTGALAASLAVVALRDVLRPVERPRQPTREIFVSDDAARDEFQRNDTRALAVLSRVADATWSGPTPLMQGASVPAGRFELKSGVVQLEFLNGANLVVEGPADIELISTKLVFCRRGKLRARVPAPAHGFTIETPTHRAVDLGTEFGVDVGADSATEVHVLDGEVRLQDKARAAPADAGRLLKLGAALRAANGQVADIKAEAGHFIGAEQLLQLARRDSDSRYASWRDYSRRLGDDPSVITYFNFEDQPPWQRILRQDGPSRHESEGGAIVGCRWAEGRWPQKQSLEFKGVEDRVKIFIPGQYDSITLACWVRVEGFDRFLSSLMLTEGHDVGEVHWQFTDTGKLLLGVKADAEWSQDYYSGVVLRPYDLGRWMHLACVYDRHVGIVAHYLDGRRVSTEPIRKNVTLRFGATDIGNWVPEVFRAYRIRNLNGRVDEFALLDKALSDDEIKSMYEAGRPNQ